VTAKLVQWTYIVVSVVINLELTNKCNMTKQELTLHLAIDYLMREHDFWLLEDKEIARAKRRAEAIANVLMPEEEKKDVRKTPIKEMVYAIDKVDSIIRDQRTKGTGRRCLKKGHAVKFADACSRARIRTIGDLLDLGKTRFLCCPGVGASLLDAVSITLRTFYDIKEWHT